MVDPLIVAKTLNHMIPVFTLLVFVTNVLRASMVVRVLGMATLGTLTTLAWLLQPSYKLWDIVSLPLGHDRTGKVLILLVLNTGNSCIRLIVKRLDKESQEIH